MTNIHYRGLHSHVLMKALVHQKVHTYKFIHSVVVENNFLCPSFSRLGPALKYIKCCLEVSCAVGGRLFTRLWPRIICFVGWDRL